MSQLSKIEIYEFLNKYENYFLKNDIIGIENRLSITDITYDELMLFSAKMKSPSATLIISIVGGLLGIDRFFIGDYGLGVLKLLIGIEICGIWWIIDWFKIMKRVRMKNAEAFFRFINSYTIDSVVALE